MPPLSETEKTEALAAYTITATDAVLLKPAPLPSHIPIARAVFDADELASSRARLLVASVVPSYMRGDIFVKGVPQFSPEEWGDVVDDGTQFVSDGVANALNHGGTRGDIIPVGVAIVTARGRRGNLLFTIGDNVTGVGEKSGDVTHGQGVTVMNECMTRMGYASPAVIRGPLERSSRIIVAKVVWGERAPENPIPVHRRVPRARQPH